MVEKKDVGDKARADNDNTERAKDVVQPDGTPAWSLQAPRGPDSNSRKAMIPRFVANWAVAMPSCNHLEIRQIATLKSLRIVRDSLEKVPASDPTKVTPERDCG